MIVPARWVALPLLAAPLGAWAVELGEIRIQSALNQPFEAQILLEDATPEELEGLSVTLSSQETFERFGLERPGFLSSLRFNVGRDADGADVVLITSTQPIAEPFVTMLVEAAWPRGRNVREYTVLLDPPLLLPEPVAAVPVEPAEARVPQATVRESVPSPPPAVPPVPEESPEQQASIPEEAAPPPPAVPPVPDDAPELQANVPEEATAPPPVPDDVPERQASVSEDTTSPPPAVPPVPEDSPELQASVPEEAAAPPPAVPPVPDDAPELQANVPEEATAPPPVPDEAPEPQVAPSPPRSVESASAGDLGGTYGPVQRGDTLWAIASQYRPDDASLFQMLLALYEANPEAFAGNMNHLYAGAILRIPERTEIGSIAADSARAEFLRQTGEWQERTQQLARLRLVPPTPESRPGASGSDTGEDAEVSELRDQVAALRSELDESQRLLEIRDQELRDLQAGVSAEADGAPDSEQLFADGDEPPAGDGAESAASQSDADTAPVSVTRAILTSTWTWIAGGAALVLLTAFLFMRRGFRKATDFELDLRDLQAEPDDSGGDDERPSDPQKLDDIGSRLDLARAYIDMGNADQAREVLAEVLEAGDSDQREEAQTLLDALDE